jgi:hypothetical protein
MYKQLLNLIALVSHAAMADSVAAATALVSKVATEAPVSMPKTMAASSPDTITMTASGRTLKHIATMRGFTNRRWVCWLCFAKTEIRMG